MGDRLNARGAAAPRIVFDYRGAAGRGGAGALFGLWNFRPAPRVASFALKDSASVAEEAKAEAPVWGVELPPNYESALAYLRAAEESLSDSERGLEAAAAGLEVIAAATARRDVNLGVRFGAGEGPEAVNRQFSEFIENVRRVITHYAFVETSVGGELLSRTIVSWAGDSATAWRATPSGPLLALHRRSLALALKSREALLRTLIVVAKAAALTSAGGVLALPLMWKYVREVMSEVAAWERLANQT